MNKYAVAHIDFFTNELIIEIVEAMSDLEALCKHSKCGSNYYYEAATLEKAKEMAPEYDEMIDVKEILS